MNVVTTDEYDAFASDYHWLYSDRVLSGAPFVDSYATVLRSLPREPGFWIVPVASAFTVWRWHVTVTMLGAPMQVPE